jgi:predicted RNase H-like nuclease (RuvC/YqgF family)
MPMPRKVDPIAARRTFDERSEAEHRDFNQKLQLAKKDEKIRRMRKENSELKHSIRGMKEALHTLHEEVERLKETYPNG